MKKIFLNQRGQALIAILFVVILTLVMSDVYFTTSLHDQRLLRRQRYEQEMFYMAEGAMEEIISRFKAAIANFVADPDDSRYPLAGTITSNFSATYGMYGGAAAESVIVEVENDDRIVPDNDGVNVREKNYRVTATIQHPSEPGMVLVLNRIITRRLLYAFQHGVFYQDDLEILPGPDMTFLGRIHSNSDIYIGAGNTLTIDSSYLRSAGNIYNRRKDNNSIPPGQVNIKAAGTSDFYAMAGLDSSMPAWTTESQTRWNGTVKSSVHGVNDLAIPSVGSIQPGGYYHTHASIKIVNNSIIRNGTPLVEGVDIPPGTITGTTSFFNNREGKTIKMTEIDFNKLGGGDFGGVNYPNQLAGTNGLVYATRDDAAVGQQPGVRLVNGSEIKRNGGITVVTNDPLYVQGDYNTTSKKPTAVICDAVNLLSNNWNDANSTGDLSTQRKASNTTINTAFIAGITTTTTGNYNGGLENYPRMHEDWSPAGQPQSVLTIRGSFVEIWNSQIATGAWHYGSPQYEAPVRNWDYDTAFSNGAMPPFTPQVVDFVKGAWWKG